MTKSALVIGGGIAGMQASLDLADQGFQVYLVEKNPSIGGNMAKLDRTFPTMDCAACIITPKLVDTGRHPNIKLFTFSEVANVTGEAGNFTVKILKKPRYVDEEKCTGCGLCAQHCPIIVPSEHEMGIGMRNAIYLPFPQAVPMKYTVDEKNCIKCKMCESTCTAGAVDFDQKPMEIEINVGAIIVATGYELADSKKKEEYGYGIYDNVITALQLERLLSPSGPLGGDVIRLSDGKIPKRIGFIQCVCSRDINTNLYCSRFCCMYAIKNAMLLKDHIEGSDITIFYMDMRTFGKGYEELYTRAKTQYGIKFTKGRAAEVLEKDNKDLVIRSEDIASGEIEEVEMDLVVLATGGVPSETELSEKLDIPTWKDNFYLSKDPYLDSTSTSREGVFVAGCGEELKDIPDAVTQASAAAMKASIILARS